MRSRIILFVVNDLPFFLSHRLPLALAAKDRGYQIHVATPIGKGINILKERGIQFHPVLISRKGLNPLLEISSVISLCKVYRSVKPDLIHQVTIKPVLYGGIVARCAGVPAVVNAISGLGYLFVKGSLVRGMLSRIVIRLYRLAHKHKNITVIFQNPDDRSTFIRSKIIAEQSTVIIKGAGVDMNIYKPALKKGKPVTIILASRMLWDKGVGDFVEAARILSKELPALHFVLVGDEDAGNPKAITNKQLAAWQDEGIVEWWGRKENMPDVFDETDIFCLPSYYGEGIPKVLIEAAASGLPIVTTDSSGCREVVDHMKNGLLVPPKNPVAIAEAIRFIVREPEKRHEMGKRSREKAVREFSLEEVVSATLDIYEDILERVDAS